MLVYIIVCPMLFFAGFVDSIAGGGGLISIPAYTFAGLSPHFAVATNKMSSAMGTTVATVHYIKEGYVKWKMCLMAIVTAFIGSWMGSHLNLFLDETILRIIILAALPVIAFYVFRNKNLGAGNKEEFGMLKSAILCAVVSLVVGVYDGLYGPGTGTFLMLLLTGLCRRSLQESAGTTKVINLTTNIAALAVYILNAKVLLPLGIIAGLFNMAGNYVGSHCFSKKGTQFVRPVMMFVIVIFFVKTIIELL